MTEKLYALYRGDEIVAVGTAKQLAERQGVSPKTIRWYASETAAKRSLKMRAYEIEED